MVYITSSLIKTAVVEHEQPGQFDMESMSSSGQNYGFLKPPPSWIHMLFNGDNTPIEKLSAILDLLHKSACITLDQYTQWQGSVLRLLTDPQKTVTLVDLLSRAKERGSITYEELEISIGRSDGMSS